jgi:hypothetical protein
MDGMERRLRQSRGASGSGHPMNEVREGRGDGDGDGDGHGDASGKGGIETSTRVHGGQGESLVPPCTRGSVSLSLSLGERVRVPWYRYYEQTVRSFNWSPSTRRVGTPPHELAERSTTYFRGGCSY